MRAATRAAHARVEGSAPMQRLMSSDYTQAEYRRHLCRLLGFYEPFEAALGHSDARSKSPLATDRSRLLRVDLAALGLTAAEILALPRCRDLPAFNGSGFLGGLYVYEGIALGGQTIARSLRRSLGSSNPFAFYHSDAEGTARQWRSFCCDLQTRDVCVADLCDTALRVFDAFAQWFEDPPPDTSASLGP